MRVSKIYQNTTGTEIPCRQSTDFRFRPSKKSPHEDEKVYNVTHVPTFIIKKDGKEIGRITEAPETGFLEKDLLNIINKAKSSS